MVDLSAKPGSSVIEIQVACATEQRQLVLSLSVTQGCTALEAVRASGIQQEFPALDLTHPQLGIFGQCIPHHHVLQAGDRVEVYRPLILDPKESRRLRAQQAKQKRY